MSIINQLKTWPWSRPLSTRLLPIMVILGIFLILGFYTVTDPARIDNNYVLNGADYVGYAVCHRITDRSFAIAGRQLPLCARCTGMYLGISLAFLVLLLAGRQRWSNLPPLSVLIALGLFILAMAFDGLNSYSHFFPDFPHLYEPKNWLRLVTGMGTGLAMGIIIFPALAQTLWKQQIIRPSVANLKELLGFVILALIFITLVLSNQPLILYVLGLVSAAGVLIILTSVNTTAVLIVFKRDATAEKYRQIVIPLMIGLFLAITQVAVISVFRFTLTGTMNGFPGL
ncbi:MAG: hypothetical protein BMS9Abin02_0701 [Anaerolineae bacterium]|nr:MAG: hypothetical protein BMS9Abin02_0701 [Anaerolineae bacterium]